MKIITIGGKQYTVPEKWDELSQQQLVAVIRTICLKNYKAEQMIMRLLQILLGWSHADLFRADLEELDEFLYLVAFLLREEIQFTRNLIPSYTFRKGLRRHTFFGPDDDLGNLLMKELTYTDHLFQTWYANKEDEASLTELVAMLYRPAPAGYDIERDPAGDRREPFQENVCRYNAKTYVARWPLEIRLAIAYWYHGCRQNMIRENADVFEGGGDPAQFGLVSVMLSIAEGNVFGPMKEVENQNVHLVMMHLNELVVKARKMKEESKV